MDRCFSLYNINDAVAEKAAIDDAVRTGIQTNVRFSLEAMDKLAELLPIPDHSEWAATTISNIIKNNLHQLGGDDPRPTRFYDRPRRFAHIWISGMLAFSYIESLTIVQFDSVDQRARSVKGSGDRCDWQSLGGPGGANGQHHCRYSRGHEQQPPRPRKPRDEAPIRAGAATVLAHVYGSRCDMCPCVGFC